MTSNMTAGERRLHDMERVRLTRWGAPHAVDPESVGPRAAETACGKSFLRTRAREPREDNPGTCVDCREAVLGHPGRTHLPPRGEMPGPRRDVVERQKRRSRRRRDRIWGRGEAAPVSDVERSRERNPEDGADVSWLRRKASNLLDRARRFTGKLLRFGGDR